MSERAELRRSKWVIAVPYFVQGSSALTEVPTLYFIKTALAMGDAGGQMFDSLRSAGWLVKPVWGYVSDRLPLFGYHRKSWFVLMAVLAVAFWSLSALLSLAGVRVPVVYLFTFNLAFTTYAFVDVVCDAFMVERGRRLGRVGAFINLQWTVLALANAIAILAGGWFQERIQAGELAYWTVFLAAGLPPLATAYVGMRFIDETPVRGRKRRRSADDEAKRAKRGLGAKLGEFRRTNRVIWLLMVFIFFWRFSPSIGFIERSYLIDQRGFTPASFGTILSAGAVTFLASLIVYRWFVRRHPGLPWDRYLYAMIAIGVVSFPLSFFLYLEPDHAWWHVLEPLAAWPRGLDPLPGWNRYEWFRLITQVLLGFATIPAFVIPLTLAGQTVKLEYAGVGYAFLMSLSNATNVLEGVVGAALYELLSRPAMAWMLAAFAGSPLDVARVDDERTIILQMFVYVSLAFTLLTIPFLLLLKREMRRRGLVVELGSSSRAS